MQPLASNPAFQAYAAMTIVLSLNMLVLWAYSGAVRGKTKTTPNAEDAKGGAALVEVEPPEVARVLRAYKNAAANILPFAILGLVYVLAGASGQAAAGLFGAFTLARLAHSWAYLGGTSRVRVRVSWRHWRADRSPAPCVPAPVPLPRHTLATARAGASIRNSPPAVLMLHPVVEVSPA